MPSGPIALWVAVAGLLGLVVAQLPGWLELWRRGTPWGKAIVGGIVGTAHAPFIYGLLLYKELPLELAPSLWYVAWVWGLTVMLGGIGLSLWRLMKKSVRSLRWGSPPLETQPERRHFLRFAVLGGLSVAASTQLLATTQRRRGYVEYVELPVSGLPPQLEGMTIGVISDVHSGPFMQRSQMEEYRRELEELQCDLIVLPGDFIINRTAEIYPFVEAFSGLKAPMGVFAVTGNHDYFSGQVERVCSEIERAGISLLRNAAVEVGRDGATITLAGIDDFYARALPDYIEHGQDPDGVLSQWERQIQRSPSPRLVLCHRPYYFEHLALLGAEGVIAGHTHGGQIVLAEVGRWALAPAAIVSPYLAGTYWSSIRSRTWMYVTRGIGTVGIPVRWNAPPEITHIRLVRRER